MIAADNFLLVAGGGQNVGKTTLVTDLIARFSVDYPIVAVKVSSHLHKMDEAADYVMRDEGYAIVREHDLWLAKDSGRMLRAGACEVFYVQALPHLLETLVPIILGLVGNRLCVCESGGLRQYIKPSVFLYLTVGGRSNKDSRKDLSDRVLVDYGFDGLALSVVDGKWLLH